MARRTLMNLALEENEEPEVTPEAVEAEPVPAEAEAAVADVAEDTAPLDDLATAVEEAGEDIEQLEKIEDVVEDTVESGEGLPPAAAEVADIAVEAIRERLGISGRRLAPSLEAFGATSSRLVASRVALEGVKETMQKAWEAVRKAIASLIERIVGFFKKHLGANEMLEKALAKLEAAADGLGEKKPDVSDFESEQFYVGFAAKTAVNAASVKGVLDRQAKLSEEVIAANAKAAEGSEKVAAALAAAAGQEGGEKIATIAKGVGEQIASVLQASITASGEKAAGGVKSKHVGVLFGGKSIVLTTGTETEAGAGNAFMKAEVRVVEKHEGSNSAVPVLSSADQKLVLGAVKTLLTANKALMEKVDALKKFQGGVDKAIATAMKKAENPEGEEAKALAAAKKSISGFATFIGQLNIALPGLNLAASKAALSYVGASQKHFK